MDLLGYERICVGYCRVFGHPDVQHPGIVFSIMACMSGNLDWIDLCGSCVHYDEEACRSALASTDRLSGARMFFQLHTLVDLFRLVRRLLCKLRFQHRLNA